MANSITYGMKDSAGHRSYHGFTIADATKTPANVLTFVNAAIVPYSDGATIAQSTKITVDTPANVPGGDTANSRRGVVILKNTVDGRRFVITIPSIKDDYVISVPNAASYVDQAACDAVKTAFDSLSGLTTSHVASYVDGSQFQR